MDREPLGWEQGVRRFSGCSAAWLAMEVMSRG